MPPVDGKPVIPADEDLELETELEDETTEEPTDDEESADDESPETGEDDESDEEESDAGADDKENEEEVAPKPEPRVSRSQKRIRDLATENRTLREDRERERQEAQAARQAAERNSRAAQERQAYKSWYEGLTPEQQYFEDQRQAVLQQNSRIAQMEFRTADGEDKANFRLLLADNPKFKKYEPEVERLLDQVRSEGVNATRDIILTQVLGMAVRTEGKKPVTPKQAERRLKGQTVKPSKPGGDTPNPRGRRGDDLESRLKGVTF